MPGLPPMGIFIIKVPTVTSSGRMAKGGGGRGLEQKRVNSSRPVITQQRWDLGLGCAGLLGATTPHKEPPCAPHGALSVFHGPGETLEPKLGGHLKGLGGVSGRW